MQLARKIAAKMKSHAMVNVIHNLFVATVTVNAQTVGMKRIADDQLTVSKPNNHSTAAHKLHQRW